LSEIWNLPASHACTNVANSIVVAEIFVQPRKARFIRDRARDWSVIQTFTTLIRKSQTTMSNQSYTSAPDMDVRETGGWTQSLYPRSYPSKVHDYDLTGSPAQSYSRAQKDQQREFSQTRITRDRESHADGQGHKVDLQQHFPGLVRRLQDEARQHKAIRENRKIPAGQLCLLKRASRSGRSTWR